MTLPSRADSNSVAAAEALFQQGLQLMKEQKFAQACPKLAESQKLDPAVGTLLYLAECYERNGQTASAWAIFELAASEGRKSNQAQRERTAKARAERLLPTLSKLTIQVSPEGRVAGLQVTRGDTEIGSAMWGSPIPVDPGKHVISANAPGYQRWSTEVEVSTDSDRVSVEVPALQPVPTQAVDSPKAAEPTKPSTSPPMADSAPAATEGQVGSTQRLMGLITAGAGVVSSAVGIYFLADAQSKESESEKYCRPPDYTLCDAQGVSLNHDANSANTTGTVLLVVGGAAVAAGAVVYFTAPRSNSTGFVRLAPSVAPRWAGVALDGRF